MVFVTALLQLKAVFAISETACSECRGNRFAPTAVRYSKWNLSRMGFGRMGLSSDNI